MPACLTPSQYPQSVDHGGVGVGAHNAVGVHQAVADVDHATQVLQVHLVNRAHVRRDHVHVLERFGAPLPGPRRHRGLHTFTHFTVKKYQTSKLTFDVP